MLRERKAVVGLGMGFMAVLIPHHVPLSFPGVSKYLALQTITHQHCPTPPTPPPSSGKYCDLILEIVSIGLTPELCVFPQRTTRWLTSATEPALSFSTTASPACQITGPALSDFAAIWENLQRTRGSGCNLLLQIRLNRLTDLSFQTL